MKSLSSVWLLATPWTAAYQAPPSMGFSRQEYWSGVPLPSPLFYLKPLQIVLKTKNTQTWIRKTYKNSARKVSQWYLNQNLFTTPSPNTVQQRRDSTAQCCSQGHRVPLPWSPVRWLSSTKSRTERISHAAHSHLGQVPDECDQDRWAPLLQHEPWWLGSPPRLKGHDHHKEKVKLYFYPTPFTKINSEWVQNLNVWSKTLKLLV